MKAVGSIVLVLGVCQSSLAVAKQLPAVSYRGPNIPFCSSQVSLVGKESKSKIVIKTVVHNQILVSSGGKFFRLQKKKKETDALRNEEKRNGEKNDQKFEIHYDEDLSSEGDLVWVAVEPMKKPLKIDLNKLVDHKKDKELKIFQQIRFTRNTQLKDFLDQLREALEGKKPRLIEKKMVKDITVSHLHIKGDIRLAHYDDVGCTIAYAVSEKGKVDFPGLP